MMSNIPKMATRQGWKAAGYRVPTKAVPVRIEKYLEMVELTITRGLSNGEIYELALSTHGGNYLGDPGEFYWSNRKARNSIRHCLTNYEAQWAKINRGFTGDEAYHILRERVDELVDEAYPQFAEGMPEQALY